MPLKPDDDPQLFPLSEGTDRAFIEKLAKSVRWCLRRKDVTPRQIHHLGVLLFGLERLPLATPRLNAELTLFHQSEDEKHYHAIKLDAESFCLSAGGYVHSTGSRGDSYSDDVLMVESGGFREADVLAFDGWLTGFQSRVQDADTTVEIDLEDGLAVPWREEPDETAWRRAVETYADGDDDWLEEDVES